LFAHPPAIQLVKHLRDAKLEIAILKDLGGVIDLFKSEIEVNSKPPRVRKSGFLIRPY
jgi:hypothetical protein